MSTTTTNLSPAHECSAWLRGAVARQLARMDALGIDTTGTVVVAPLVRDTDPDTPEDRQCDRCETFVPIGPPFYPFPIAARPGVVLVGGLCQTCRDREVGA